MNRLRGTTAALVAAFILAVSPAAVGLDRGNIADTAMTLFLVLAADAVSAAMVSGRQRYLVYAGVWVGIAFQAKMLEAWLVLRRSGSPTSSGGEIGGLTSFDRSWSPDWSPLSYLFRG